MSVSNKPNSLPPTGIYQLMSPYRADNIPTSSVHDTSDQNQEEEHAYRSTHGVITGAAPIQDPSPIEIWDVKRGYPGNLVISSGRTLPACTDIDANACNLNLSFIDSVARNHLGRYLIRNGGHLIKAFINDASAKDPVAYWSDKTKSIHFAPAIAGSLSSPATKFDIAAHELGHAIVYYTSNLTYSGQSGALNESFADIFAIMAKHCRTSTFANNPDANWNIADGLLLNTIQGTALRSMSNPGSAFRGHPSLKDDTQTSHMNQYQPLPDYEDCGGVHRFSGIPNKAFYLAAREVGGHSWEKAGNIWYQALQDASKDDDFSNFACRTMAAVKELKYGAQIYHYVGKAWQDVGVDLRRHVYPVVNAPSASLRNLQQAISYFSCNDGRAWDLFRLVCLEQQDAENAAYKILWDLKGRPKDVCYEYGRLSFNDAGSYRSLFGEKAQVLEKYKTALSVYETTEYNVPGRGLPERIKVIERDCLEDLDDCIETVVKAGKNIWNSADLALGEIYNSGKKILPWNT